MAKGKSVGEFIGTWVNIAAAARDKVLAEMPGQPADQLARADEKESILISLRNLMTFPWIRDHVEQKQLFLHGWYFNIGTGQLRHYCEEAGTFEVLVKWYVSA